MRAALTGQSALFARPPAGLRHWFQNPVLAPLGRTLVSWSARHCNLVVT